jgi:hypothetical protein
VAAATPPEAERDNARRGLTRTGRGRAWRITRGAWGRRSVATPSQHRHTIRGCLTGFFDSGGDGGGLISIPIHWASLRLILIIFNSLLENGIATIATRDKCGRFLKDLSGGDAISQIATHRHHTGI